MKIKSKETYFALIRELQIIIEYCDSNISCYSTIKTFLNDMRRISFEKMKKALIARVGYLKNELKLFYGKEALNELGGDIDE